MKIKMKTYLVCLQILFLVKHPLSGCDLEFANKAYLGIELKMKKEIICQEFETRKFNALTLNEEATYIFSNFKSQEKIEFFKDNSELLKSSKIENERLSKILDGYVIVPHPNDGLILDLNKKYRYVQTSWIAEELIAGKYQSRVMRLVLVESKFDDKQNIFNLYVKLSIIGSNEFTPNQKFMRDSKW